MYPPAARPAPLLLPAALPVPVLAAPVTPRASKSFNHLAGAVSGQTNYQDLNACAWYQSGGWDLRNGRKLRPRGLSGGEDSSERHS